MSYAKTPEERFAKCWSDAMFGYANAMSAACWAMTGQMLTLWGEAADGVAKATKHSQPADKVESWYKPDKPVRTALLPAAMPAAMSTGFPWGFASWTPAAPFATTAASRSPIDLWFDMLPINGSPAAWPMACAMLSAGLPKAVAWPTAEANVAMLGAAKAARESWDAVLSQTMPKSSNGNRPAWARAGYLM